MHPFYIAANWNIPCIRLNRTLFRKLLAFEDVGKARMWRMLLKPVKNPALSLTCANYATLGQAPTVSEGYISTTFDVPHRQHTLSWVLLTSVIPPLHAPHPLTPTMPEVVLNTANANTEPMVKLVLMLVTGEWTGEQELGLYIVVSKEDTEVKVC